MEKGCVHAFLKFMKMLRQNVTSATALDTSYSKPST